MIDTICANVADTHWARMQEHDVLYRASDLRCGCACTIQHRKLAVRILCKPC